MTSLSAARRTWACRRPSQKSTARAAARAFLITWLLAGVMPPAAFAQTRSVAAVDSTPRYDREGSVFGRIVTVQINDWPLGIALQYIAQEGNLRLSYSSDVVPVQRRV